MKSYHELQAGQCWTNDTYMIILLPKDAVGFWPFMYMHAYPQDPAWRIHESYASPNSDAATYIKTTGARLCVDIGAEYAKAMASEGTVPDPRGKP